MEKHPPDIVFVMADDMGYGDVGCFNPDSKIPTPNMDRLAHEGMMFTDAHSGSAVCTPSRYSIMTGRYCWRSRLKTRVLYGYEPPLIEADRLTVAGTLKQAGYHTACIGKWHLGLGYSCKEGENIDFDAPLPWGNPTREQEEKIDFAKPITGGPLDLGFDYFFGTSACSTCNAPYAFIENNGFPELPTVYHDRPFHTSRRGMMAPGWEHKEADPTFARKAIEYIESRRKSNKPFFLYLAASAPHEPCEEAVVPEFARGRSHAGPRGDLVWLYDWMVGQVMDALDRTGLADNTLIMVTSDNGGLPGDRIPGAKGDTVEELYNTYGHKSCGDWRGYKAHIWEGGHREPLIVRRPGHVKPNSTSSELVCLADFMATCADITGVGIPDNAAEDSVSILPILTGDNAGSPVREDIVHHSANGVFSIRKGPWKCIFGTKGSGGWPPPSGPGPEPGAPGQLYNIEDDPAEQVDLWDKRQDIIADMRKLLENYRKRGRSVPYRAQGQL